MMNARYEPVAAGPLEDNILTIQDLKVSFRTLLGTSQALNGISLSFPRGKVIGIVGESGCGKSMMGLSILQIVPEPGRIDSGNILLRTRPDTKPVDILEFERDSDEMRNIRGKVISMIFQEPMTSLNPCYTVGDQIKEAILLHTNDKAEAANRAVEILRKVEMPNAQQVMVSYPHQLSGGMRQRAVIAMALSCLPVMLVADEPTTALDVTTEAQILALMRQLQAEIGMSIAFITHNMGVIAQMCDEVAVMYLGRVVEQASVNDIFYNPKHPYTISLLRSIPRMGSGLRGQLESIKGNIPDPYLQVPGCPFHPRCPSYIDGVCNISYPDAFKVEEDQNHIVNCHVYL